MRYTKSEILARPTLSYRETLARLRMRKRYYYFYTNEFREIGRPCFDHAMQYTGTPRQIASSLDDYKKGSGDCWIAYRIYDPLDGAVLNNDAFWDAVRERVFA